ncbi:hypothetical protein BRADI_3g28984v3 [Brachypodium distachyon]|uniref:DUF4283 domain-containing protein n=1 Tax=Brachypodium distachyon TaxID=15368 RepID=A0A2K2CZW2_BRADI|nr:hypothetical protein BRADI_3g28984v3 [Brachypodium distachyon]
MVKEFRWLALARVHTPRPFSVTGFKETMRSIWSLVHDAHCREVDNNLFLIRFFCIGDWKKVMNQGPCHMGTNPLNPDLYRRESVCDQLARRIGRVLSVEMNLPKYYEGDYIRECGDGVHAPADLQYGKWLLAKRRTAPTSVTFASRAPSTGRRGGRGGFGGRDLADTATSPAKQMQTSGNGLPISPSVSKKLEMGGADSIDPKIVDATMGEGTQESTDGDVPVPPPPPKYTKLKEHKRAKQGGASTSGGKDSERSTTSMEEDRRAQ